MTDRRLVPPLDPGDVYVYSHGNGAIFVLGSDDRSRLVTLSEVAALAASAHAMGARVIAAWDDTPIAREVIERLRLGTPVVHFAPGRPPHSWRDDTDALMDAAAVGADRLLDDLIGRGVDVDRRDVSGASALHHAAAHGNLHAIDALVAAGAEVDQRNDTGLTPHMVAMATRQHDAARRLVELGADPDADTTSSTTFSRRHAAALHVLAVLRPSGASWTAGAPRRLDGTVLTLRGIAGQRRTVDLRGVTCAAIGGSTLRAPARGSRWLVLAHPEGRTTTRRTLGRLRVPPAELDLLAPRIQRAVVVPLAAVRRDEVILAVGNVLSGRGVDLSRSLRRQLADARRTAWEGSADGS